MVWCVPYAANHTPFTDIERVSDYEVDFKYKMFNEEDGMYEENLHRSLRVQSLDLILSLFTMQIRLLVSS